MGQPLIKVVLAVTAAALAASAAQARKTGVVKYTSNGTPFCQYNDGSIIFPPFIERVGLNGEHGCYSLSLTMGSVTRFHLDLDTDGSLHNGPITEKSREAISFLSGAGLGYPGAVRSGPDPAVSVLSVNRKPFAFLTAAGDKVSLSVRLSQSRQAALQVADVRPAGYGLAKSGWVTLTSRAEAMPSRELLRSWLRESYISQAPSRHGNKGSISNTPSK
jgi:predicted DNA-binding protein (MmcQ/YjbR family)